MNKADKNSERIHLKCCQRYRCIIGFITMICYTYYVLCNGSISTSLCYSYFIIKIVLSFSNVELTSSYSMQLPLLNSTNAMAVMDIISKPENFIVASTGVSPTLLWGGGFFSGPARNSADSGRSSLASMMEGIPEEEDCVE